jgi:hypothetical protein
LDAAAYPASEVAGKGAKAVSEGTEVTTSIFQGERTKLAAHLQFQLANIPLECVTMA